MGCCQKKFRFPPGDEFGDAYNKYMDINEQHLSILKRAEKLAAKAKSDPMAALKAVGEEFSNIGNTIKIEQEREESFKNLEAIYKKLKDSNSLGANAELKTQKFNEIISQREAEAQKAKKDIEDAQNQLKNLKNFRI